jgi:hypothetical protein
MTNTNDSDKPTNPKAEPLPQQCEARANGQTSARPEPTTAQEMQREFRWFEFGSLFINGALAVIGVIALCIYGGQLREMKKSTKAAVVAAQAASDNAVAAKNQSEIAKTAYAYSRESFRLDQRPYVTVAELSAQHPAAYGDNEIILKLHNTGKTPAINVRAVPLVLFGDVKVALSKTTEGRGGTVMASNGITADSFVLELGNKEVWEVVAHKKQIVFRAVVTYGDIFKDQHTTKLCAVYTPEGKNFVYCAKGNEVE